MVSPTVVQVPTSYPSNLIPRLGAHQLETHIQLPIYHHGPSLENALTLNRVGRNQRNSWTVNRSLFHPQSPNSPNSIPNANLTAGNRLPFVGSGGSGSSDASASSQSYGSPATAMHPDSMSVFSSHTMAPISSPIDDCKKYNTLTAAEAKRITKFMGSNRNLPIRTASVMHKPRAPPLVPSYLEIETNSKDRQLSSFNQTADQVKSATLGSRSTKALSVKGVPTQNSRRHAAPLSPDNSVSHLSFRSSLDAADNGHNFERLQTMSVDLGASRYPQWLRDNSHGQAAKFSDESYSSALSHHSQESCKRTKPNSKISISSSTSKVLQSHLSSIKKFFRYIPIRRSADDIEQKHESRKGSPTSSKNDVAQSRDDIDVYHESVSQLSLNRSLSPAACPPPPRELKSMSYMESAVNYSNYDEFTRKRNDTLLNNSHVKNNPSKNSASDDSESWQLTSLPVGYERNLATVFEEKQNSSDTNKHLGLAYNSSGGDPVKPKLNDPQDLTCPNVPITNVKSSSSSCQSLASETTNDSALNNYRQAASSFRFSYAQPDAVELVSFSKSQPLPDFEGMTPTNSTSSLSSQGSAYQYHDKVKGLPPRTSQDTGGVLTTNTPSAGNTPTKSKVKDNLVNPSESYSPNGFEIDPDITIVSETSTLRGDSGNGCFSKQSEFERTVEILKRKLIGKERELTDLQLKQLSSDYLIDQLKSTISQLERENAQLKSVLRSGKANNLS